MVLWFQSPIEEWPLCDCLISFHSIGFPLEKAQSYAALRKPYVINNLDMQHDVQVRNNSLVWNGIAHWLRLTIVNFVTQAYH